MYSLISWTVENGLWAVLMVNSWAVCFVCHSACEVPLSLFCKSLLRYVKSWQNLRKTMIFEKKTEQDRFMQYLVPFSSECCMYWYIKLTLFVSFCVGLKFGVFRQEKNMDWGFVTAGWWGEYWMWAWVGIEGCRRFCSELQVCYISPGIINIIIARKMINMWHLACI